VNEGRRSFFVTGAAGFLGAHLVRGLLSRGHSVTALVRHGRDGTAGERFRRVLAWLGVGHEDAARVSVVAGDVAVERFGLPETTWRKLAGSVDEIVHCAASTAFTAGRRTELERVNVAGTGVVLALAAAGAISAFHQVSTAYAAGCADGVVDETWREPAAFTNAYEETKHRAEALARAVCAANGIQLSVYRPSIVYGDSRTGRSLRFNALYYPVKMLLFLRDIHLADARGGGARSRDLGIASLPGGGVRLPLRIETHPDGGLDLVPIDHFARAFLAIRDGAAGGGTFHIVSGETTRIETVIDYIRQRFRIEGFEAAPPDSFALRPRTPLEVLFEGFTAVYRPYMLDRRRFDDAAAGPLLAAAGVRCPNFTFEVFDRSMRYAEEVAWGKSLFDAAARLSPGAP
jgi:thioester reductase-like protein